MRRLILFVLLFHGCCSFAQSVGWTRQFSMGTNSSAVAGSVFSSDSVLYSIATVRKWGYNPSGSATLRGLGLVKTRTFNGDTVFVRRLQGYTPTFSGAKILRSFEGNFVIAVVSTSDTIFDSKILVQKVDTNGNAIWMLPLSAGLNDPQVIKVHAAPDGGTFILGSDFSTIGGLQDWLLIKVSYDGQLMWSQRYSGGTNWYCEANNIEPLRNGNYLISGMAERTIWSVEVDADGNQIDQHTFWYGSVPNLVFDAVVRQTSYKSFAVSGTYASNPRTLFLGKFDSIKTRIWGGETQGRFARIQASTSEGKIIVLDGRVIVNDSLFLTIYNPDSSIIWRLGLPRSGLTPNNPEINDIVFDGNGGVILCGSKKRQNSNRDELFFMKISGVGLPYDPFADTVLVSNRNLKNQEKLMVYPNPATDKVWFSGLKEPFQVVLYSADGRKLVEKEIDEKTHLSLNELPQGLYTYRIGIRNRWWTGKIIKE